MIKLSATAKPGFSFIEMMIAITLMAVFMGVVGPSLMKWVGRGKAATTASNLKFVKGAIQNYVADTGRYPNTLQDLIQKPEGLSGWDGPYVGDETTENLEIPKDGWGNELEYKLNDRGTKPPFELYSNGDPDKDERIYAK